MFSVQCTPLLRGNQRDLRDFVSAQYSMQILAVIFSADFADERRKLLNITIQLGGLCAGFAPLRAFFFFTGSSQKKTLEARKEETKNKKYNLAALALAWRLLSVSQKIESNYGQIACLFSLTQN